MVRVVLIWLYQGTFSLDPPSGYWNGRGWWPLGCAVLCGVPGRVRGALRQGFRAGSGCQRWVLVCGAPDRWRRLMRVPVGVVGACRGLW